MSIIAFFIVLEGSVRHTPLGTAPTTWPSPQAPDDI
jgi:hypothetical protein